MLGAGNTEMYRNVPAINKLMFCKLNREANTTAQCAKGHSKCSGNKADRVTKSSRGAAQGGVREGCGEQRT